MFNVVTGGGAMGQVLAEHRLVDKVAFTGKSQSIIYLVLSRTLVGDHPTPTHLFLKVGVLLLFLFPA